MTRYANCFDAAKLIVSPTLKGQGDGGGDTPLGAPAIELIVVFASVVSLTKRIDIGFKGTSGCEVAGVRTRSVAHGGPCERNHLGLFSSSTARNSKLRASARRHSAMTARTFALAHISSLFSIDGLNVFFCRFDVATGDKSA